MNRDQFYALFGKGFGEGSEAARQGMASEDKKALESYLLGQKAQLDAAADTRKQGAAEEMFKAHPNAAVGAHGFSINPENAAGRAQAAQGRLEIKGLSDTYSKETGDIKKKQGILEQIAQLQAPDPTTGMPTALDEAQMQRMLAMAVNSGALSDEDVRSAVPRDIAQTSKSIYNYLQPLGEWAGMKKQPIYSDETRGNIQKLIQGKIAAHNQQLGDAEQQLKDLAPYAAPSLSSQNAQNVISGITGVRNKAQQRLSGGQQQATTGQPSMQIVPSANAAQSQTDPNAAKMKRLQELRAMQPAGK